MNQTKNYIHQNSANGRWYKFSLAEQLGNVGSEVERIINWQAKGNKEYAEQAFFRAIELLDLTKNDPRWRGPRRKEIGRTKEFLCEAYYGIDTHKMDLNYFKKYFMDYAIVARRTALQNVIANEVKQSSTGLPRYARSDELRKNFVLDVDNTLVVAA